MLPKCVLKIPPKKTNIIIKADEFQIMNLTLCYVHYSCKYFEQTSTLVLMEYKVIALGARGHWA